MTGRTGYTGVANSDPMQGPAQIDDVYAWFDPLVGETEPTSASLPSTGNWIGRTIYVQDINTSRIWDGTEWAYEGLIAAVTTFGPGFTSNPAPNNLRILRQGNRRTLYGEAVYGTGSSYSNVLTVPTADQPPSTSSRTIGIAGVYSGSGSLLLARATLLSGVVSVAIGSGSLPIGTVYLSGLTWYMD